jgi:glutamine synthetase
VSLEFDGTALIRNEGDGSSVPSGGLRDTHASRAYTLWDHRSHLYIRKRNNTLYIPSLLATHYGKALGDKSLLRMSERALER